MKRKFEQFVYLLSRYVQKLYGSPRKGWMSFTCMVVPTSASAMTMESIRKSPYSFRGNYFLIVFLLGLPILLFSAVLLLERNEIAEKTTERLESRYVVLSVLQSQFEHKRGLLTTLGNKQAELAELSYGGTDWKSQLQPFQLANILFLSSQEPIEQEARTESNLDSDIRARELQKSRARNVSRVNMSTVGVLSENVEIMTKETSIHLRNEARPHLYAAYQKSLLFSAFPIGWAVQNKAAVLTSGYGYRTDPLNFQREFHAGTDFAGAVGTPIIATAQGRVFEVSNHKKSGYGKYVKLRHGFGFVTLYAHCSAISVRTGDWIERGQVIGYLGATGRVTGPHLHYEVRLGPKENIDSDPFVQLDFTD